MVNIAIGNLDVEMCPAGDDNSDGQATVDEIITAVNNALRGCRTPAAGPPPPPTPPLPPPPSL
jgi:hypothetical protein